MFAQLLLLAAAVQDGSNEPLAWRWDPDSQLCALTQTTDADGDRIEITRTPGNDETSVTYRAARGPNTRAKHFPDGVIRVDSGEVAATIFQSWYKGKFLFGARTQDQTFMQRFASASTVQISRGSISTPQVPLKSAAAAADALRRCEDQKMRGWGIDPVNWRVLKSRPVPLASLRERFSSIDYPLEALTFLVPGDALTLLEIGADGAVTRCKSLNASQYKGFEYATCNVLKGARFTPAVDAAGNPVSAPYVVSVRFRIAN